MDREQKIELVAGTTNHSVSFITGLVKDNDRMLENMVLIAKSKIEGEIKDELFETLA